MKAIVYDRYGSVENLALKEIPEPEPKDNEVLVQVHATGVNSWDVDLVLGKPWISRMGGWFKPKYNILGADIAGIVVKVGKEVQKLKEGDEVFGDISESGWGGFAEYVCAQEKHLSIKSPKMSFEQAAALPQAGVLALQALHLKKIIGKGDKILINGAGGGVGTIGLQLAKPWGCEITCVDRADKLEVLSNLGADHVIDYQKTDYTKNGNTYDLIIDPVARKSIVDYKRCLNKGGLFVMVGGTTSTIASVGIIGNLLSGLWKKKMKLLLWRPSVNDLNSLKNAFDQGSLQPIIEKVYPLEETPMAIDCISKGDFIGKVVVKII